MWVASQVRHLSGQLLSSSFQLIMGSLFDSQLKSTLLCSTKKENGALTSGGSYITAFRLQRRRQGEPPPFSSPSLHTLPLFTRPVCMCVCESLCVFPLPPPRTHAHARASLRIDKWLQPGVPLRSASLIGPQRRADGESGRHVTHSHCSPVNLQSHTILCV